MDLGLDFNNYDIKDCYEGRYKEKYQFMMLGYDLIDTEKIGKPNMRLYLFLRRYVRKVKSDKDPLDIFTKYYAERDLLATSWTMEKLAERLKVSKSTIEKWVRELVRDGALTIEKVTNPMSGRQQNVYILGKIGEKYEIYDYEKSDT
jgi:DNA-binding MarR family transcriptional regulator